MDNALTRQKLVEFLSQLGSKVRTPKTRYPAIDEGTFVRQVETFLREQS